MFDQRRHLHFQMSEPMWSSPSASERGVGQIELSPLISNHDRLLWPSDGDPSRFAMMSP